MTFPFEWLSGDGRQVGLVVAVAIGFGFGFVLERAGFGRAQKLVAQFFGTEMTVFKVMFGAIVTAMLGAVILSGVGLMDLRAVASSAASETFLWPMLVGGFLLGVGFIVSGYCPGTSIVAAASGKLDGLATVVGVVVGTVAYGELQTIPAVARFHASGALGHVYLYELLHVPPAVVALGVVAMAIACFLGAERLERLLGGEDAPASPRTPRRAVLAGFGAAAVAGVATLALPAPIAAAPAPLGRITAPELAARVFDAPWTVRILDTRPLPACTARRIPGAECAPPEALPSLYLADASPARDLVVVTEQGAPPPAAVEAYRGRVLALDGGFAAWSAYALAAPPPLGTQATTADREAYRVRAGIQAALTGAAPPPPPPAAAGAPPPRKKGGGGGCGG